MFQYFARFIRLLFICSSLAQITSAHQVDTVEFEFLRLENEWRLEGEMDIAYMLPETRNLPGENPISRKAVMEASAEELERIRRETENTLRKLLALKFDNESVPWTVHFPDFDKDPFELPEELSDWGLITVWISVDPQPGAGELVIHWSQKEKAELILLIEEGTEYPRIVSVRAGGHYSLLEKDETGETATNDASGFGTWIVSGYRHVLPLGMDHMLFIFGLFLMSLKWRPLMWQSFLFTLSHSISLALSVLGIVSFNAVFVEIAIAFSIAFIGIENLVSKKVGTLRYFLVFAFGLLHGLGFANVLSEKLDQLPNSQLTQPLIGFNLGVELAQITVLLISFLIFLPIHKRVKIAQTLGSIIVTIAGLGWMSERIYQAFVA